MSSVMTTDKQPNKPRRRWHWWYDVLLILLAIALALGGFVAFVLNRQYFPRFGLPEFDKAKAVQLTPEKRAAYEQELFSELSLWNMGSRRYPNREDFIKREQRWQEMADDGLELAHITLEVLSPSALQIYAIGKPMKRLEELADQGDPGAMCLMTGLMDRASEKLNTTRYEDARKKWLERGAGLGHPECLRRLGGRLLLGVGGYSQDIHKGLSLEFAARRAGYLHDAGALVMHYTGLGYTSQDDVRNFYDGKPTTAGFSFSAYKDLSNARRLYCWAQIEAKSWDRDTSIRLLEKLQEEVQRTHRSDLNSLYDELRDKHFGLEDCLEMGTGE